MFDSVKNLDITFDCHLPMKTYISSLVRSANFELSRISSVRHLLSTDATKPSLPFFLCTLTAAILSCLSVLSISSNQLQISLCLESAQLWPHLSLSTPCILVPKFSAGAPVIARPSWSRQKQNIDLGKLHRFTWNLAIAPLTDHHGWNGDVFPCLVA